MIKVGDKVLCKLYNTPERKFYGESWKGEVLEIRIEEKPPYRWSPAYQKYVPINDPYKVYRVSRGELPDIELRRKEILRIITKKGGVY